MVPPVAGNQAYGIAEEVTMQVIRRSVWLHLTQAECVLMNCISVWPIVRNASISARTSDSAVQISMPCDGSTFLNVPPFHAVLDG